MNRYCASIAVAFLLAGCSTDVDQDVPKDRFVLYEGERLVIFNNYTPGGFIERKMDITCPDGFYLTAGKRRLYAVCVVGDE